MVNTICKVSNTGQVTFYKVPETHALIELLRYILYISLILQNTDLDRLYGMFPPDLRELLLVCLLIPDSALLDRS